MEVCGTMVASIDVIWYMDLSWLPWWLPWELVHWSGVEVLRAFMESTDGTSTDFNGSCMEVAASMGPASFSPRPIIATTSREASHTDIRRLLVVLEVVWPNAQ